MQSKLLTFIHFLAAVVCSYILASLFQTQFVLHELRALGIDISLTKRIEASVTDLQGLLIGYGGIIAVALLLGFVLINVFSRYLITMGRWRYVLAGFIAMLTAHTLMFPIFNVTLIAGARSELGMLCQALAGAFGGWVFMYERGKSAKA